MTTNYVLSLADKRVTIETTGGKGASLARLSAAGLPVPDGFHTTTEAYRRFVAENDLQPGILAALEPIDPAQPATLEAASARIHALFTASPIPTDLAEAIKTAYTDLTSQHSAFTTQHSAVAVRSSATAEDLPEASFAGQQESFLNIHGIEAVLDAVKRCWASLWTARAIAYRRQHAVSMDGLSLAVVVQLLVPADAAGILFTANPITGQRDQAMISAAWGLGEAVVGGIVTPDMVVVDKETRQVISREVADKQVMTVRVDGTTETQGVPASLRRAAVLDDATAAELVQLGNQIEALYGQPMDVEWALAGGHIAILQARPITALLEPAAPASTEWTRPNPKAMYARGSLAEHLPNPVSPLFGTMGLRLANVATNALGEDFLGTEAANDYQYRTINGYAYLGIVFGPKEMWKFTKAGISQIDMMLGKGTERWQDARQRLIYAANTWEARPVQSLSPSELLTGVNEVLLEEARFYTVIQSGTLPTASSSEILFTRFYNMLVKRKGDPDGTTFLFGFDTVTMLAEKSLFDLAQWAKQDPVLCDTLLHTATEDLAAAWKLDQTSVGVAPDVWAEWRARFQQHLDAYGHTSFDFDFVNPTPAETPGLLLDAVKMYLEGKGHNPYERQVAAAERREQATQAVLARIGWPRKNWFRRLLGWAQRAVPAREDSLADLGLGHAVIRRMLNELGRRFVAGGALGAVEDVYWLEEQEVQELAAALERGDPLPDCSGRIPPRKAAWQAQRQLNPPAMLPENSRWAKMVPWAKGSQGDDQMELKGFGASGGKVTGTARVLFGPEDFGQMQPGDVLVAVTTTPAWTALFAMASAVVTDIGGPLSHSSIVAREYGIPAVMATGVATRRIHSGQVITVDGGAGVVLLANNQGHSL